MTRLSLHHLLPIIVFFIMAHSASAQWTWNANSVYLDAAHANKNVGIGTGIASVLHKFQVKGGNVMLDYASGVSTGNLFFGGVTAPSPGTPANGMRLSFANPASNGNGYIDVRSAGGSNTNNGLLFRVDGLNGGTERMRICANGNIGVGIATPGQKLQVHNGAILVSGTNPAGGAMVLFGDNNLAAHPAGRWGIEYVPNTGLNFWKPFTAGNNGANYHLLLRDDGKVGIGIDPSSANCTLAPNGPFPPGYRLYVKEGILTEKVKIANYCSVNWADYVFAPDYQLQPLSEVEAFVKANRHLPNVPSAQEIENDGLDVADMLSRQMEKIEELMLHTIALNKRVEKLEAENAALKQQPATAVKQ